MGGAENRKDKRVSAVKITPGGEGAKKRVELQAHRLQATLAIVRGNTVSGTMVPLKDISKTGCGVYTKFPVDPQTQIRISIDGINHGPIEGKVVWCGPSIGDPIAPPTHPYRVGIEFTPKDDADRDLHLKIFEAVSKLVSSW